MSISIIICAIYIAMMGWLAWEFGTARLTREPIQPPYPYHGNTSHAAPICDEDDQ